MPTLRRHARAHDRSLGVLLGASIAVALAAGPTLAGGPVDYPLADAGYHSYAELREELQALEEAHPDILDVRSIGDSAEGRPIYIAQISDDVDGPVQDDEPEVVFDGLHHAREHLSAEMTISILHLLVDRYGETGDLDRRVTDIVDHRVTWIVFMLNPDGLIHDLSAPAAQRIYGPNGNAFYAGWRKNRSDLPGTTAVGIDLNRNYGYRFGCCNGSSGDPRALTYRGRARGRRRRRGPSGTSSTAASSTGASGSPRTSRSIPPARSNLYPYGYTHKDVPRDMTVLDHRAFVALARAMADRNGYTPKQSSSLYVTDGDQIDWMYGRHRIFSFTFEMYPTAYAEPSTNRFYPPDERVDDETRRNREAVLYLLEQADCPYRSIGEAKAWCGPFFDDLEVDQGWRTDPDGTDTATAGAWRRGIPEELPLQRASASSGQSLLVTGRSRGVDVDGGRTTVRSPLFRLPEGRTATLRLRYWFGLDARAGAGDSLTVRLVDAAGTVIGTPLLEIAGDGSGRGPMWRKLAAVLPPETAGLQVAVEIEARDDDGGGDATVEAGVDTVRVTLD